MFDERYDCVNKRRSTHAAAVERNNREGLLCQRFEHKQWALFGRLRFVPYAMSVGHITVGLFRA